jgi:Papain-like cysteine protease AvrRpt2
MTGPIRTNQIQEECAMADLVLRVPLVGQKVGYDGKPLMQPNAKGVLAQHGFMACWYASATMVSYYYRPGPRLGLPTVWSADKGMTTKAIDELAKVEGLRAVATPTGGLTRDAIYDLLKANGPIWAAGYYLDISATAGHAIVITGVEGPFVHYNDPWEPRAKKRAAEWFTPRLLKLPNALLVKDQTRA